MALNGKNITLPIYHDVNGQRTSFHNLVLHKFTVDSVVMSLGDKITGDVYYNGNLACSMQEYVVFNDIEYTIVNPPTLVREGLVKENSDLKGMSKYSFEFYHPMYMLGNLPFTDVAVSYDELRYKSQDKTFSWIGKPADFVAKLNKNLDYTEWVVVMSDNFPQEKLNELSEVLTFDNNTIADVLKTGYETWGTPFIVDKLHQGEYYYTDAHNNNVDYYTQGKRFVVVFGLPSNEIYDENDEPFVFRFGQGVGLKNNSRTPRNNKIITRIAGYGSENNIPYGYPQIRWYGDPNATCTIGDSVGAKENVVINGVTYEWAMSYPIYDGIVGGEWVKLIKHPFTRKHLMPTIYVGQEFNTESDSIYAGGVFNKVSQFLHDGTANPNYNPDLEIKDYYDAVDGDDGYDYVNLVNLSAPSYEIHGFDDIKPELGEAHILGARPINADTTDADSWDDTMDDNGNYLQSYFKITLPQLSFDIYACAAITQEMQINMRSGACIGCTFTVQVDWEDYKNNFYDSDMNFAPNGDQRNYERYPDSSQGSITVIVQKDNNTFGTLMPNIYQHPHGVDEPTGYEGDAFVVLGISLPYSYITNAQSRLDDAMKSYMLENNLYYFDYPLKFDEHFLAKNTDILNQIRPNTRIRFEFNGSELELFVKQLTIKFYESTLPQYDITLTDNVEIVLNSIGQVADDVEHLSTLIALLRQQYNKNVWEELSKKLSKVYDDTASGLISFAQGWETFGFMSHNFFGTGAKVNVHGDGEFESINVRGALRAAELIFNKIFAEEGESIRSIGHGEILTVDEENMTATLKLEGDEWPTIDVGDSCRGLYNTIGKEYDNSTSQFDGEDENGFRNKRGFFASYFKIEEILSSGKGQCEFRYSLQTDGNGDVVTEHPCPMMKFAVYGNTNNNKPERQSCMYITAVGIAPRLLFLARVNDWQIKPENIKVALGNIDGVQVMELIDGELSSKTLEGDAGIFVEDNIYLGGIINQFTAADWDYIQDKLGQGVHAQLIRGSDNIVIDALGNVVGGLYTTSTDGTTTTTHYKLHTGVVVYDSGKKKYLTIGDASDLGEDEFALYVVANGCTILQDGADVFVTAINNTANGAILTDEQLEAMRDTNEFSIDFVVVTKNGWRTQMSYPVKITHLDYSFITFDLTNEMDSMSYRTQTLEYDGLPITSTLKAYVNGVELSGSDFVSSTMSSNGFTGSATATSDLMPATKWLGDSNTYRVKATLTKAGVLTIAQEGRRAEDLDDTKYWFDIQSVVKYAGVQYTSPTKRFIVTEATNSTLYKLLLSANAVSKDGGLYIPSTIDVKVQIIDDTGTIVKTASEMNSSGNIKVYYVNGVYDAATSTLLTTMPNFNDVPTCLTVVLLDVSDENNHVLLDLESVPMTAVGRNGAGQPWVQSNYETIFIDCDSDGNVDGNQSVTITASLYWGDSRCELDTSASACLIHLGNEVNENPDVITTTTATKTYSFQDGDSLSTSYITIYLIGEDTTEHETHNATKTIAVVPNKQGTQGATGNSGAAVRFRGVYSDVDDGSGSNGYLWNDNFRDCVKEGSSYYLVNVPSDGDEVLGTPNGSTNTKWDNIGQYINVATELLLAENAVIELLYSNVIKMRNQSGTLTASINEDQHGSYRIYYPSGQVMMEFSYEGYIYYYNDDATHSRAWKLGLGGDISKENPDDWIPFFLSKINNYNPTSGIEVDDKTDFRESRERKWKFMSGSSGAWAQHNGKIFNSKDFTSPLETGWYTPNQFAYQILGESGTIYAITVYHITNGLIDNEVQTTMY